MGRCEAEGERRGVATNTRTPQTPSALNCPPPSYSGVETPPDKYQRSAALKECGRPSPFKEGKGFEFQHDAEACVPGVHGWEAGERSLDPLDPGVKGTYRQFRQWSGL